MLQCCCVLHCFRGIYFALQQRRSMKRKAKADLATGQASITNFFAAAQRQRKPNEAPTAKKHKLGSHEDPIIIVDDADAAHVAVANDAAGAPEGNSPAPPRTGHKAAGAHNAVAAPRAIPSERETVAHSVAQAKLVSAGTANDSAAAKPQAQHQPGRSMSRLPSAPKYTPLEQQVVSLRAALPGVMLVVEVGYKMRLFGQDAEVAARELGIYCYQDHNFMTASFPVQRLPIHIRRLVAAGHKVGVVRQTESAALKAAGDNKSAPFTRSLTGLFTAATLEAAEKADKLDEASYMEVSQELEATLGGSGRSPAANYILVVKQELPTQTQQEPAAAGADSGGVLGLVAVDAGSGDIAYGLASVDSSSPTRSQPSSSSSEAAGGSSGGSSGSSCGGVVMPLEAVLLSLTPSDIVVCEPISAAAEALLKSYIAGASRRCRLERLKQQQQREAAGRAGSASTTQAAAAAAAGASGGYLDAALMNSLVDFFSAGSSHGNAGPARGSAGGSQDPAAAASLQFILSLPQPVLCALAGGLAYLTPFGLQELLRCTSSYRALNVGGSLTLGGNALRQLEVMEAGVDSRPQLQGSLLHLVDRCSTAAGGRMLRRWLAAPLADRNLIVDRQEAVQALLDSITGGTSQQQQQQQQQGGQAPVLQQLPSWLAGSRQDLERALARVAAGTAAPAEAVGLWTKLSQLPAALQLPLRPPQQQPQQQPSPAQHTAGALSASELDRDALTAAVPSRLLVSLLAATAGSEVAGPAAEVLACLDGAAAAKNDYLALFKSRERFPQVFSCQAAVAAAEDHLQQLLPKLAATAGVASLSYTTIQNQGSYLVELPATRTNEPQGWDKVCATKKVCRYHPTEVKQGMAALAQAQEHLQSACGAAWTQLLQDFTAAHHAAFRQAVAAVAQLDALHALAVVATSPGYCRPQFVDEGQPQQLVIKEGKHPMLDLMMDGSAVANDLELRWDGTRAAIITGPNMGGKSVLMRQAAVTVIMAQLGSWVPASSCVLSVFDGVFCRMGASDCLLLGRSTFAEELGDASHILANATNRSLVIMDELGRGTATHDGVAIACATLSHLVSHIQCLSLFVTHYPEVASLASSGLQAAAGQQRDAVVAETASTLGNSTQACAAAAVGKPSAGDDDSSHIAVYHMSYVRQDDGVQSAGEQLAAAGQGSTSATADRVAGAPAAAACTPAGTTLPAPGAASEAIPVITFLYKLVEGAADESFGLNVAQMAGLPYPVVQRAAVLAKQMRLRLSNGASRSLQHNSTDMQQQPEKVQPDTKEQPSAHTPAGLPAQQGTVGQVEGSEWWQLARRVHQTLLQTTQAGTHGSDLITLQAAASQLLGA